jgi:AAA domain
MTDTFERACRDADEKRAADQAAKRARPPEASPHRETAKHWRQGLITAAALQSKQFKPVRIILPGLIPEGVTIVAGKPKVGKSWLALDVCLAVADENRFVLGDKRPVHGAVLYLALEDNERRLKKRIDKIVQAAPWPTGLELHTEWKRMDHGGLEDIEAWITSAETPRLVWIDTLAKIRPIVGRNEQAYTADYRAIEGLQKLSGQYGVGVVLNHHLRKMSSEEDAFDDVSGTLGLTGAADTIIVMKRHSGMMKIYVRGRDIEEAEFAAEFNRNTCRWRLVGGAEEVFRSQERQAVIAALRDAGRDKDGTPVTMSVAELMAATERTDRQAMYSLLHKMQRAGDIVVAGRGLYALPDKHPSSGVEIVEMEPSEAPRSTHTIPNVGISAAENLNGGSQRDLNGNGTVEFALRSAEAAKPLGVNKDPDDLNDLNDLNGSERADGYPDLPNRLQRAPNGGGNGSRPPRGNGWRQVGGKPPGEAGATVWLKEVWPPAISSGRDDDVFDLLDSGGRQ